VTNKRSHFAKKLVDGLIKQYEREEISKLEFIAKVSIRYKKNGTSAMFPLTGAGALPPSK